MSGRVCSAGGVTSFSWFYLIRILEGWGRGGGVQAVQVGVGRDLSCRGSGSGRHPGAELDVFAADFRTRLRGLFVLGCLQRQTGGDKTKQMPAWRQSQEDSEQT